MAETLTVTPTGVGILYEDGSDGRWRSYRIAALPDRLHDDEDAALEFVREHGEKYPSVTTILGVLDKPGLPYAAEKLTVAGCVELAQNGGLPPTAEEALSALNRNELRFRQIWDQKAERGKLSHEDLVHLAQGRSLPGLETYPEDQLAFIRGVASFLADLRPEIVESEVMVASVEYGYAGRFDMVASLGAGKFRDGTETPKGRGLIDLKTSEKLPRTKPSNRFPDGQVKTPYPENFLQLGLYEVARRECGYEGTDWQAVVRVDAKGEYDFTCSWLEPEAALDFIPAHRRFKEVASRVKRPADQLPVGLEGRAA